LSTSPAISASFTTCAAIENFRHHSGLIQSDAEQLNSVRVTEYRDLTAFDERARDYESGRNAQLHFEIVHRTLDIALTVAPRPSRVLDVGCGTGYLLRTLADRLPEAEAFEGVDPAPTMIEVAKARAAEERAEDARLSFRQGVAEQLPFESGTFDLLISTTSFDHWADQQAGLVECARVLRPGGQLVLVDQFSLLMAPTLVRSRRGKARTKRRATSLVTNAGFEELSWHRVYAVIINGVTGRKAA
jgi:SAM-dependent methyltransferase